MGGIMGSSSSYTSPAEPIEEGLSAEKAREDRLEMIKRRRRGRASTVHTGWTGDKVEIPKELRQFDTEPTDNAKNNTIAARSKSPLQSTLGS